MEFGMSVFLKVCGVRDVSLFVSVWSSGRQSFRQCMEFGTSSQTEDVEDKIQPFWTYFYPSGTKLRICKTAVSRGWDKTSHEANRHFVGVGRKTNSSRSCSTGRHFYCLFLDLDKADRDKRKK